MEKRSKFFLSKILLDPVLPLGILKEDLNFQNLGFFGSGGQTWGPILILSLYHLTCVTFHFINFHVSPHHHTCITFHSINFHISPYHISPFTLSTVPYHFITLSPYMYHLITYHLITFNFINFHWSPYHPRSDFQIQSISKFENLDLFSKSPMVGLDLIKILTAKF